jgi:hypothetical protein
LVGFISTLRVVLISFCIKLYYVKTRGVHCTKLVRIHVSAQEGY